MKSSAPASLSLCVTCVTLMTAIYIAWAAEGAAPKQLLNLADKPAAPRFKLTGRVWPQSHGDLHLCLWAHDKMATVTFSVDDNFVGEHDWWLRMGRTYGIANTWFVMVTPTMYNYDGTANANTGYIGTLESFKRVFGAGHDVQGHGVMRINNLPAEQYRKDITFHQEILQRIPGNRVLVYAYPGGNASGHKRSVVADHYIGARGTVGGINPANRTDYLQILTAQITPEALGAMLDNPSSSSYRGWLSQFVHGIGTSGDAITKQAQFDGWEKRIALVCARRDQLWITTYREAFLYAQSRDTARMTPGPVTAAEIRFSISDDMRDDVYTYPLTVKVRVDDSWDAVTATQAGKPIESRFVMHDGGKFLIVQAVPDAGEVVVTRVAPTRCMAPVLQTAPGRYRDRVAIKMVAATRGGRIRYTLDGTDPAADSAACAQSVVVDADGTVELRAACFREGLAPSEVVAATYVVDVDATAPQVVAADAIAATGYVAVTFDEPMNKAAAEHVANYSIEGVNVQSAQLAGDGRTVVLTTDIIPTATLSLVIDGLTDLSGNAIAESTVVPVAPSARSDARGLVAHWRFAEQPAATYVLDSCAATPPAMVTGKAMREQTDKGPAFAFDGDSVILSPATTYGLTEANAFSVAFWVRFDGSYVAQLVKKGRYSMPFSVSGQANRTLGVFLRAGGRLRKRLPGKIQRGSWYHVAATAADGRMVVYLNGEAVATEEGKVSVRCPDEPLTVGANLTGRLADLRVYSRALTLAEVADLVGPPD